jgi:hypothetical protein
MGIGRRSAVIESAADIIMAEIAAAGDKGITQTELLDRLDGRVHRATVFRVTKKFARQRKMKIKREGKKVRYYVEEETALDTRLGAFVLSSRASSKLFTRRHQMVQPKESDYIEKTLLEFSDVVGAFISYVFLMGMHPENKLLSTTKEEKGNIKLVKEWTDNAISSAFISRIQLKFKEVLYRTLSRHHDIAQDFDSATDFTLRKSLLDKDLADRLNRAFRRIYPTISRDLDNIMENLSHKIKLEKEFEERAN